MNYTAKKSVMAGWDVVLVADWVKVLFQNEGLRGLEFHPTVPITRRKLRTLSWGDRPPFWELRAAIELPPCANRRMTEDRRPARRDQQKSTPVEEIYEFSEPDSSPLGQWLSGQPIRPAQLHYHRRDIEATPAFDFAVSWESIAASGDPRRCIVSQRFYQVCREHKIRCSFEPVAIDD